MKKLLAQVMLLADYEISWPDRLKYSINAFLHFAPVAVALDLFNWWWKNDFNLLLTLDTSDAESSLICKLEGDEAPITQVDGVGRGTWQGTLHLRCINDGRLVLDEGPE